MKKAILECIDLHKLRLDYWSKIQKWDDLKKEQRENSKAHNGYIDRPEYHRISKKVEEAREEVASMYRFIDTYFVVDQIEVKRGQYSFTIDGHTYTLVKMETEDNFGWRKGITTHWEVYANDQFAKYHGEYADTKSELIDLIRRRQKTEFINWILGPNPLNS